MCVGLLKFIIFKVFPSDKAETAFCRTMLLWINIGTGHNSCHVSTILSLVSDKVRYCLSDDVRTQVQNFFGLPCPLRQKYRKKNPVGLILI